MTIPSPPDHSHASAHAARFFDSYFAAKSEHSLDRWMDHFDPHNTIYADATLGWLYPHRSALRDAVAQFGDGGGVGDQVPLHRRGLARVEHVGRRAVAEVVLPGSAE